MEGDSSKSHERHLFNWGEVLEKVPMAPVALIEVHHIARQQLAHTRR